LARIEMVRASSSLDWFLYISINSGCDCSKSSTVSSLPYWAARSRAVSSRTFRMLGSAPYLSSRLTTPVWPYWAPQCRAVSLSLFYTSKSDNPRHE
jgi:hypothetical protein